MPLFSRLPDGVAGVPGVVNGNNPNVHGGHPSGLPESGVDNKNVQGYCQVSRLSDLCKAIIIMGFCYEPLFVVRKQWCCTNYIPNQ